MRPPAEGWWLTRFLFLRALGCIYALGFLALALQLGPLIGAKGLLPAASFLRDLRAAQGGGLSLYLQVPSLFWLSTSDAALHGAAWLGLGLSLLVVAGRANAPLLAGLWLLYSSFVHVGQLFYGYGWEMMLLEAGFLAVFLCPLRRTGPFEPSAPPPAPVLWLARWMLFRVMFGAGLIKLRGDPCWRDLSCLLYHYETQPIPNPLSWYFHHLPAWMNQGGVLFNHLVELVVPWFLFGPRRLRLAAGLLQAAFQVLLILSGNLSWLNYLTLALCIPCFDDAALGRFLPRLVTARVPKEDRPPTKARRAATYAVCALVGVLSLGPVANMLSPGQAMNASFDPFNLVNTYGAFGSVGTTRYEVVLEGTRDERPEGARWSEYAFRCKPGDPLRRPCVLSPYHSRLDWQIWFAAMSDYRSNPWLVHFVYKLLQADHGCLGLLAGDPFQGRRPAWIRAELYEYRFSRPGEPGWWVRTRAGSYLPPLSLDDPGLRQFLHAYGWGG